MIPSVSEDGKEIKILFDISFYSLLFSSAQTVVSPKQEVVIVKITEDEHALGATEDGAGADRDGKRGAKRAYQPPMIISYTNEEIREKLGPAMAGPVICSPSPPPT